MVDVPIGLFKSIEHISSPLLTTLQYQTTTYSYGNKILSTKQVVKGEKTDGMVRYPVEFGNDYWTAFMNGLQYLNNADAGLESVLMSQVF
jgi:hypothetical protein